MQYLRLHYTILSSREETRALVYYESGAKEPAARNFHWAFKERSRQHYKIVDSRSGVHFRAKDDSSRTPIVCPLSENMEGEGATAIPHSLPDTSNLNIHCLKSVIGQLPLQLGSQTKGFLLMSAPFLFDWNQERIGNNVIQEQMKEIDYVQRLQEGTLFCTVCHLRRVIDRRVEGINYCKCRQSNGRNPLTLDSWEPYLERDNIIIWRQDQGAGQYAYKVYGCYADVSAEDFFFVQTDVAYRQQWDKTALALDIIDTDQQRDSNCIVMYWEMLWPVSSYVIIRCCSENIFNSSTHVTCRFILLSETVRQPGLRV